MADGLLTRTTIQAPASVDNFATSTTLDQPLIVAEPADSQLAGPPPADQPLMAAVPIKRKRGRPPRNPVAMAPTAVIDANKRCKNEEEDVCFICFDGGSLVLCDRRDCPKAYHPACIKRDEAFFRSNIRWNCGWHLCNFCQRNALFMCYMCPYSLCKRCVKQADILCVRGNKGFCRTCMTTIMLIENIPQENKELVQVDFDDSTSWEYLFKVYWVLLKQKESFALDELIRATNPWKVSGLDRKDHFPQKIQDVCVSKVSDLSSSDLDLEENGSKRRKMRRQSLLLNMDSQKVGKADLEQESYLLERADWASKELLEFVVHMKNGDTSVVSQFDVQALLLDYIRINNLCDPRQKCQIICDRRLENLFGKSRVGHFEMLKLLEYHFKEESRSNGMIRGAAGDPCASKVEADGITADVHGSREMKWQTCRKSDEKGRQNNLDSFAAINVHNINLIYLKQSLLEKLMVDAETFHDKIVGSIVRIRITSNDQKQEMHRLVRIIGTTKTTVPYKIGDKMENIMLRILNLNKIEDVTIDAISEQEFSEDECRRLRQSIKLGLVERLTVGEIQDKAMALQTVRANDSLEAETMRLKHLRDRANEMGHLKELRECVEKIELLKTPEEHHRRICEIPEVYADPRMDPSYGSDDDSGELDPKKQDGSISQNFSKFNSKAMELISPAISKDEKGKLHKASALNGERKRKNSAKFHAGKVESATRHLRSSLKTERVDVASVVLEEVSSRADLVISSSDHSVAKMGSMSEITSVSSMIPSKGMRLVSDVTELEKIWHYQDPSGKIQGPFCLLMLRKWDSSGFFPTDLKVWRINETQHHSILLSEALRRQPPQETLFQQDSCLQSYDGAKCDKRKDNPVEKVDGNIGAPLIDRQSNEESSKSNLTVRNAVSDDNEQFIRDTKSLQVCNDQGIGPFFEYNMKKTHPVESSSSNGKPSLGVATSRLGTLHVSPTTETLHIIHKTELSDHMSATLKSNNVNAENQTDNNEPPILGAEAPDSANNGIMASNGTRDSDVPSSLPKTQPEELKWPNVENKHPVASNSTIGFSVVPDPMMKTGDKEVKYYDTDNKHSDASVAHDSGITSTVHGGVDVSMLPSAVSNVGKVLKPNDAENKLSSSTNVSGGYSISSCSILSGSTDVSVPPRSTPNVEDLNTHTAESKHYAASNVPEQDSGSSWSTISVGIVYSDVPGAAAKLDDEGMNTSAAENKHCNAVNASGLNSGTSWNTIASVIEFADRPSTSLNLNDEGLKGQVVENKDCVPSNILGQNSCISWSTASNLMSGEVHVHDVPGGWGAYQSVHAKPSVEEFDLVPCSSAKLAEVGSDHAIPNADSCQLTLCSSVHLDCDTLGWQLIDLSLGDESVSDLLSEVLAMESRGGMSSPTSRNCGDDSLNSPQDDCFSPLEGLCPNIEPGKNDASSSTADLHLNVQPNHASRQHGAFPFDINYLPGTSCIFTDPIPEVEGQAKPAMVSLPHHNYVSEAPPPTLLLPPPPPRQHEEFPFDINDLPGTSCIFSDPIPEMNGEVKSAIDSMPHLNLVSETPSPSLRPPPPPPQALSSPSPSPPSPPKPPTLQPPSSTLSLNCPSSPVEEGELDPTCVSVHRPEVTPQKQPSLKTLSMKMEVHDTCKLGQGFETTSTRWERGQENTRNSSTGSILGNPNMHSSNASQGMDTTGANMHRSTSVANQGSRPSQTSPRYSHGVGRHSVPKDRGHHHHYQGVESGFGKSRPTSWNRQSSFAGGGGSLRPQHRGQRVCKFYESGHCNKGASCKYLHP